MTKIALPTQPHRSDTNDTLTIFDLVRALVESGEDATICRITGENAIDDGRGEILTLGFNQILVDVYARTYRIIEFRMMPPEEFGTDPVPQLLWLVNFLGGSA